MKIVADSKDRAALRVELTRGQVAVVDATDAALLSLFNWTAHKAHGDRWYARALVDVAARSYVYMHRLLTSAPQGLLVDHKDGDGLNNRRRNIRVCTDAQNVWNSAKKTSNKSGYKGVCWYARGKVWQAELRNRGRYMYLGRHESKTAAAIAYNIAAVQECGEYALLNPVFSGEVP